MKISSVYVFKDREEGDNLNIRVLLNGWSWTSKICPFSNLADSLLEHVGGRGVEAKARNAAL
jgi:hypothetical protein